MRYDRLQSAKLLLEISHYLLCFLIGPHNVRRQKHNELRAIHAPVGRAEQVTKQRYPTEKRYSVPVPGLGLADQATQGNGLAVVN
jgi:hypothetical protein